MCGTAHEMPNAGRVFESLVYKGLQIVLDKHDLRTARVIPEDELRRCYGWASVGVDFLILCDSGLIAIQTKYKNTRRREDRAIHSFVSSVNYLLDKTQKPLVLGLWVSRMRPFEDNVVRMRTFNIRCIHNFYSMTDLVRDALQAVERSLAPCTVSSCAPYTAV